MTPTCKYYKEKWKIDYLVINFPCFMDITMAMHDKIHDQRDFEKKWEVAYFPGISFESYCTFCLLSHLCCSHHALNPVARVYSRLTRNPYTVFR